MGVVRNVHSVPNFPPSSHLSPRFVLHAFLSCVMKVKEGDGALPCEAGQPIVCGNVVRLEHVPTGKNLHSHVFKSPLSRGQEVR